MAPTTVEKEPRPHGVQSASSALPHLNTKMTCACEKGFKSSYHKVIQAVIVVKATVSDFTQDAGGVKTAFLPGLVGPRLAA